MHMRSYDLAASIRRKRAVTGERWLRGVMFLILQRKCCWTTKQAAVAGSCRRGAAPNLPTVQSSGHTAGVYNVAYSVISVQKQASTFNSPIVLWISQPWRWPWGNLPLRTFSIPSTHRRHHSSNESSTLLGSSRDCSTNAGCAGRPVGVPVR